jgi:hypothetical protein
METTQEAIDKLAALVNPELWLHENGYRGKRNDAESCVIASYLNDKTGIPHLVNHTNVMSLGDDRQTYSLPETLARLTRKFDRGACPGLVGRPGSL